MLGQGYSGLFSSRAHSVKCSNTELE